MTEYLEALAQSSLFSGLKPEEIAGLLDCIHARNVRYTKDELIVEEGSVVWDFGILLSGRARSVKWNMDDKMMIITLLEKGSEIAVMLAASPGSKSPVSVQVQEDASVLLIPFGSAFSRCEKACPRHDKLLGNYIHILAKKGLVLHERLNCLLKPTVREKVLTYLKRLSNEQKNRVISAPLNRNLMAEYLNVERSALSRELSNMKKDGLIDYHKNSFKLL